MSSRRRRAEIVFLLSFFSMLVVLYTGKAIAKHILHQKMVAFSVASTRESDGASNRVIMNGKQGYLGNTAVRLQYLEDGWIVLTGDNVEKSNGWILLSEFTLEPGSYTLTGLKGEKENTVALRLHIEDEKGYYRLLYQYNNDVRFTIDRKVDAALHARVYPEVEEINVKARPAVYRDE